MCGYRREYEDLVRYKFDVDDYPYIACKSYEKGGNVWRVYHNDNTRKRLPACNKNYLTLEAAITGTYELR